MMKIITVIGARPQFIKAATVSREFLKRGVKEVIVHTGQHYDADMSEIFFRQMEIPNPDYYLGVGGGRHGAMTGRQLEKIEDVLIEERPDWVLVYGDTNSTLSGALAAAKLNIPVAHVEAGLRSFNRRMPEEINRVLVDHISTVLFAPTSAAIDNLLSEGIMTDRVELVGDVMYDAALFYKTRAQKPAWFDSFDLPKNNFGLCTIHRAENTEDPDRLRGILEGLQQAQLPILLPLHPRTRDALVKAKLKLPDNVYEVPPLGYLEMTWLEINCRVIATDSGGVQKEAYFHGKPCVTLREETEWVELVREGANALVGYDSLRIGSAMNSSVYHVPDRSIFGDGDTASKIVSRLVSFEKN